MRKLNRIKLTAIGSAVAMASALLLGSAPVMAASTNTTSTNTTTVVGGYSISDNFSMFDGGTSASAPNTTSTPPSGPNIHDSAGLYGAQSGIATMAMPGQGTSSSSMPAIYVSDSSGTLAGWKLEVQASQMKEQTPSSPPSGFSALTLPSGTQQLAIPSAVIPLSSQASSLDPTISGTPGTLETIDGSSPVTLVTAPAGTGSGAWGIMYSSSSAAWQENFNINSKIADPANWPSGTPYTSTITLTLVEG